MAEPRGAAHLSIGEVLGLLLEEFPDVTISKIRFLESQGLIEPERTASGYRKFFDDDVLLGPGGLLQRIDRGQGDRAVTLDVERRPAARAEQALRRVAMPAVVAEDVRHTQPSMSAP